MEMWKNGYASKNFRVDIVQTEEIDCLETLSSETWHSSSPTFYNTSKHDCFGVFLFLGDISLII